jgi:hypothetical protein
MKLLLLATALFIGQISNPGRSGTNRPEITRVAAQSTLAPGTYRGWHNIDEVTLVQPFNASGYSEIAVESFDISEVKLPPEDDNRYRAVQSGLRMMKPAFIDGLERKARRKANTISSGNSLIIRARVIKFDPGSQAARYLGGFAAGAALLACGES